MKSPQDGQRSGLDMKSEDKVGKGIKRVNQTFVAEEVIEVMSIHTAHNPAQSNPIGLDNGQNGGRPPDPT